MNKFKSFFTFLAFVWLCCCAIWAFYQWISDGRIAWLGLFINASALPVWMGLRLWRPQRFRGDLREAPAFIALLTGLAITLLTDAGKGEPVYLALYNLFVVLVYLYHLSALSYPSVPGIDSGFPALVTAGGEEWVPGAGSINREEVAGALLVFLRGSFCADSRALLLALPELARELDKHKVQLFLFSTEAESHWRHLWPTDAAVEFIQLSALAAANRPFVASDGTPFLLRLLRPSASAVCRPSSWLLDREGFVLWRHLPDNYRTPGDAALLRGQLYRLHD